MAATLIQPSTHDNIIMNDNQVLALLENTSSLEAQQPHDADDHYDNNKHDTIEETELNEEQQRLEIMNYLKSSPVSSYTSKRVPRLGPFLLLKTLGVGEFGKVKLGKHIETGQIVAVKLVKKENIDSSSQLDKIRMEIDILKTLNHPYIVKLLSVNETNTNIGMVLEYAQGGELFEYIYRQRYLKEQEACRLFSQLTSSVYYMHQKNIVHRDLKLENILLDRHGNLIVTDFGFANQFTPKTGDLMSTSCGSPVYAAPELVMTGRLYAGTGVDIWSCGIILYAMLCGYLPFDDDVKNPNGDNIGRLYRYIMANKPKYPQHLSDLAKDLIGNMLIPDPNERCKISFIMNHPWLKKYKTELSKTVQELEKEAHNKKQLLLRGIESTTDLNLIGTEDDDDEDCCDSSDHEACSGASSVSSSYSYPPSYSNAKDARHDDTISERDQQDIEAEETDQHSEAAIVNEPILHLENKNGSSLPATPIPSLDAEEEQAAVSIKSSSSCSHASHHSKKEPEEQESSTNMPHQEAQIAVKDKAQYQENNKKSKLSTPAPIVTATKTDENRRKRYTIDAAVTNAFMQQQQQKPKQQQLQPVDEQPTKLARPQQHLSLRAKLFSSVKRRATNKSNGSQTISGSTTSQSTTTLPPVRIYEKPSSNKNRHSWQQMMHRNTTKETLPVTPPTSPIVVEHSKSERLMTWLKKSKSTQVKKPRPSTTASSSSNLTNISSGPSSRATTIPEEPVVQDTIPVARPTSTSLSPSVSRTPTLQHKRKQQQLDTTLSIETELRVHTGAMNRSALTSKPPMEVLLELNKILLILGIDVENVGGYKLHCTRRAIHASSSTSRQARDTTMDHLSTRSEATMLSLPIYGHPSMDRGDEIRFSIEVCRFENLSGLFSVDIQSLGEETEGYQFVGQKLLSLLHFGNVIRNTNFSLMLRKESDS